MQTVKELLDGGSGEGLRLLGEMRVGGGGAEGSMAQPDLDLTHADTGFEKVGRPGVAKGMDRDMFGNATLGKRNLQGSLEAIARQGTISIGERKAAASLARGKEPARVAMATPVVA